YVDGCVAGTAQSPVLDAIAAHGRVRHRQVQAGGLRRAHDVVRDQHAAALVRAHADADAAAGFDVVADDASGTHVRAAADRADVERHLAGVGREPRVEDAVMAHVVAEAGLDLDGALVVGAVVAEHADEGAAIALEASD